MPPRSRPAPAASPAIAGSSSVAELLAAAAEDERGVASRDERVVGEGPCRSHRQNA